MVFSSKKTGVTKKETETNLVTKLFETSSNNDFSKIWNPKKSPSRNKRKSIEESSISNTRESSSISKCCHSIRKKSSIKKKKVRFQPDFVEVIEIKSYKKYNILKSSSKGTKENTQKCACVIV